MPISGGGGGESLLPMAKNFEILLPRCRGPFPQNTAGRKTLKRENIWHRYGLDVEDKKTTILTFQP